MIIFTMLISAVFLFGALVLHTMLMHAELKGYERGMNEAEEIISEVRNESDNVQEPAKGI